MDKKVRYYIDDKGDFVIENYNLAGPFANFLPGIAGLFGIPMWAFYVNRGQCMCSVGVESKDSPIMEFLSANRAFQLTPSQGFRTFLKINHKGKSIFYEPFRPHPENGHFSSHQKMFINSYELTLKEFVPDIGLDIEVKYFTIPNEPFAALARILTFRNASKKDLKLRVLDGTPIIIPYGVSNFFLQKMRRTVEAWMRVENIERHAPFYRLNVDPSDISETAFINEGNFYLASLAGPDSEALKLPIIVDPEIIFGQTNDFSYPVNFVNDKNFSPPSKQICQNKLPCAISAASFGLKKKTCVTLYSLLGHMDSKDRLNSFAPRLRKGQFFIKKREENREIVNALQSDIFTSSGDRRFDFYCSQTFLDNVLRGGYPITCGKDVHPFYVYSRKHGDLERDYNRFYIDPTYFSQGNGNFRDMNQNRRSDVFFNPDIKDSNILQFYSLIQPDGFNPLVLYGVRFRLKDHRKLQDGLKERFGDKFLDKIKDILSTDFTPGELFMRMENNGVNLKRPWHEFLSHILKHCKTIYAAEHSEGFWIDHWTYNLDLVEAFLSIYPEKLREILLDKKEFIFYDSLYYVRPRSERYLLNGNGKVRQYHSLKRDNKKEHLIKKRDRDLHVLRTRNGEGEVYKTTLLVKMLCLIANKISSLDPFGKGIEMEADKPGWCDSMNGLPGLLGSSTPEVFELHRQVAFLADSLKKLGLNGTAQVKIPEELLDFLKGVGGLLESGRKSDLYYWDKSNAIKERYRERVRPGFTGTEKSLSIEGLGKMLNLFLAKLNRSIKKSYIPSKKTYATYFINEVTRYKKTDKLDPIKGLPLIRPLAFKSVKLPLFLEGVVRAMKVQKDKEVCRHLQRALKKTGLYDKNLKMYKINESLEGVSKEVGRSSVFTPGWLENQSIWLHMEYKYLLEILKAGLYKEFFREFNNLLIPFQKPEIYGRSIFENSSFIVSSAFPEKGLHGKGFVARLSGSTAEMINIWLLMNIGPDPFYIDDKDELALRFRPALPARLFTKAAQNGFPARSYAFKFLGKTMVAYHNPKMKNTAGKNSAKPRFMVLRYDDGKKIEIKKPAIPSPYAQDVRDRKVKQIDIYLG